MNPSKEFFRGAVRGIQSGGVSYDLTATEVIAQFNRGFLRPKSRYVNLKNLFEGFNVQGCRLN